MGVLISQAMAQLLCALIMLILKMGGHRRRFFRPHRLHGLKDPQAGRVALGSRRHIGHRLGQGDLALGQTDPLHRLGGAHRHRKGVGIGIPHILGGTDDDPSGDEFYILTGIQHPGQVIKGRVRIRAPHALYEGGDRIVMIVPVLVIPDGPLLDTLGCHRKRDMDLSVLRLLRGKNPQLHSV